MVDFPIFKMLTIGLLPSPLKIFYYRLRGAKIGSKVRFSLFSYIDSKEIIIGNGVKIGFLSFIKSRKLVIGKYSEIGALTYFDAPSIEIGDETVIMEQTVIGGMETEKSEIKIGDRCKVFPYCFLNTTYPISIGDDVGIGGSNYLFTHGSWQNMLDGFPIQFGPITIEDGVWLPWRVFIMPNVKIGKEATIGAGALVTKDIPGRSLAVGIPAKVIKQGDEYIKQYTYEDKTELLMTIIESAIKYFTFLYWEINKVIQTKYNFAINIMPVNSKVEYYLHVLSGNQELEKIIPNTILISLSEIPAKTKSSITENNGSWFDLDLKEWSGKRNEINLELKNFLGRYGIRLKYIEPLHAHKDRVR